CDPAHRQKSHRSRLNASNDFFRGCEAASAKTRETSKPASAIKCSITLVLVGIIRRTTLNVNPNRGGVPFVSTRRPSTNSALHSFCQRAVPLALGSNDSTGTHSHFAAASGSSNISTFNGERSVTREWIFLRWGAC